MGASPRRVGALAALLSVGLASSAQATTFTVNSSADTTGTCPSTSSCTLRTAITNANSTSGAIIGFIFTGTISPASALPTIVKPTTISGAEKIELDGASAGAGVAGLTLGAGSDHSVIDGLAIDRFKADGIDIVNSSSTPFATAWSEPILAWILGLEMGATGSPSRVRVTSPSVWERAAAGTGNTIGSNQGQGIKVGATSNATIENNGIGTDNLLQEAQLPNGSNGIELSGSSNDTIGAAGVGNLISNNGGSGIDISGGAASSNTISGNTIGLNSSDAMAGNANDGIEIDDASGTTIGGSAAGAGNTISGNGFEGVGLFVAGRTSIVGNRIGTTPDGIHLRPNFQQGIRSSTRAAPSSAVAVRAKAI